jgi:spore coat polysaccharide biosynthesis predicted glycosyltransferase SpsG
MAELMANSDLAIGGAGITAWERCCLGLPSLVVILANNQLKVADALKENGCAKVLGGPDEISKNLQSFIQGFLTDEELLKMSHSSRLITDGTGVTRVKKIILDEYEW